MSRNNYSREHNLQTAAADVLRDHGQPLHYELLTDIINSPDYVFHLGVPQPDGSWRSTATSPEQLRRALSRAVPYSASPGVIVRQSPGVFAWRISRLEENR